MVTRVELRCLLCGRNIGRLETAYWVCIGPVLFRPAGVDHIVRVTDWRRLRCASCGGNAIPDEVTTIRVYPPLRWHDDPPRRGRPPKWLVAARKAQAASGQ